MSLYPKGGVALVEPGHGHKKFVHKATPRYALIKLHHANRLLKNNETADTWFPDETQVITSTNIIDERNVTIPLEHNGHRRGEIDIVREFGPDFHIPADRSDYITYSDEYRYEKTKECMVGTVAIANHIADEGLDTKIIPLVKTATPEERTLCYQTISQLGLDYAAVYCNQYFNDGRGLLIDELQHDLELIANESEDKVESADPTLQLFTISCLSPNLLAEVPDAVIAGSGQMVGTDRGWRESITPTSQSSSRVKTIYADIEMRVADVLDIDIDLSRYEQQTQHDVEVRSESVETESAVSDDR